ncbi:MAG: hypothetical protein NDI93_03670 [Pseudomonas sp.]|nr:hypothetical protein [Pseudomonas sp.]
MSNRPPPEQPSPGVLRIADHQHILAELDALLVQLTHLMQRFESTGRNLTMKADYLELHDLQARILDQRQQHLGLLARLDPSLAARPVHSGVQH